MADTSKISIEAPVKEVTLMEDRARVTRRCSYNGSPGAVTLSIEGVSPLISDKTLLGRSTDNAIAEVLSVAVGREHREVSELDENDVRVIQEQERDIQRQIDIACQQLERKRKAIDELEQERIMALDEMAYDTAWAKASPDTWDAQLAQIREQQDQALNASNQLTKQLRELHEKRHELMEREAAMSTTTQENIYRIEVIVDVKAEGVCELSFEYIVPCACWRPCHTATLKQDDNGSKFEMRAEGSVWQNTGEDWKDVQLFFSTQRPSLGLEPPELDEDILHVEKKSDELVVEVRDQIIQDAGQGQGAAKDEMPGIDDGGEVLNLRAASLADIPSDGRPYRVEIFTLNASVESELICMPELVTAIILKSTQNNSSSHPLLAGPVDLIRNSGKVGSTSIDFVAPGEKFELGWGPDPDLRVQRRERSTQPESKMLSSWEVKDVETKIHISNIGNDKKTIHLKERIPVSEIEDVEIKFLDDKSTGDAKPDNNGFLNWTITIEPFDRHTCEFAYTQKKKKKVVGV